MVQLRGQLIDDREWSVAPSVPQLVIGTVDQIGSRLLFQGYGLGKWSLPLQAALLAIDAWICVDEAHLVPAFVLTLRQFSQLTANAGHNGPQAILSVFDKLPFWTTELSATPALPPPRADSVFRLIPEDEDDPRLTDRLLAARIRQVRIRWVAKDQKPEDAITKAAADFAGKVDTVATFIREAGAANRIGKKLEKQFKGRVLTITGRLRGYERDRLEKDATFRRFQPEEGSASGAVGGTAFLVGTAAAEVGLDADAAAVVCDFASLPTLLQRLGRLDRRGRISRGFQSGQCDPPTMTVFAKSDETVNGKDAAKREKAERDIRRRVLRLARSLRREKSDVSAPRLAGTHWRGALAKDPKEKTKENVADTERPEDTSPDDDGKAKSADPGALTTAATWRVLLGRKDKSGSKQLLTNPALNWLHHPVSCVTGGPVAVPPLTSALIEHWAGTTKPRNAYLPVHPFLYGILPDEEGTPLIGVAFRLEMDALATGRLDGEDEDDDVDVMADVEEIFRLFPPRRAELHFVPITASRDWFTSAEASAIPVAHFDGEVWSVAPDRQDRSLIQPGSILVLPTLAATHDCLKKLIEEPNDVASRDVLDGVTTKRAAYWRRIVQVDAGDVLLKSDDGATRIEKRVDPEPSRECTSLGDPAPGPTWQPRLRSRLKIGTAVFRFEYLKPKRPVQRQLLDDLDENPGHLSRAEKDAARIAETLAPANEFLRTLLVEAARAHDEGKRNCKWQRAMGNPDCAHPVAKPLVERPASMGGFRHEWESLLKMRACLPAVPDSSGDPQDWLDLWRHLVVSHHGHLRPWISSHGFSSEVGKQQQSVLRLESAERFSRLQRLLGPWRLAYLEALIKAADAVSSQPDEEEDGDEQ
ncbi:MAG: type I-U CRISPR-associated helicase/endonuclease Cas3 [Acidobacteria bacterium]|nr:type I-U CRISPR-associated helicase/endonuclease Cas3 [Acidobacteriota bacterium]